MTIIAPQVSSLNVAQVICGDKLLTNQNISIKDGLIESITPTINPQLPILSGTLIPGFIDLQVNGGGDYLFNETPDLKSIEKIAIAHQQYGTTSWLPTLVTDSLDKMQQAADAVAQAIKKPETGVIGIHFEGPHLAVEKKGVHPQNFIRGLSPAEKKIYLRKDLGKVLVTLAPEMVTNNDIQTLVAGGVIVSLGHSNATFLQCLDSIKSGASGFTHLFNAMSPFGSREPGMVGAALSSKECFYGLILDNIHVHPETVKVALKANSKMMLVTDAMPTVGSEKAEFNFFGETIFRVKNKLTDREGRLAGSNLTMLAAVKNCISLLDCDLKQAVYYASKNPALFLRSEKNYGCINVGQKANFLLLDENLKPKNSWIEGRIVFSNK